MPKEIKRVGKAPDLTIAPWPADPESKAKLLLPIAEKIDSESDYLNYDEVNNCVEHFAVFKSLEPLSRGKWETYLLNIDLNSKLDLTEIFWPGNKKTVRKLKVKYVQYFNNKRDNFEDMAQYAIPLKLLQVKSILNKRSMWHNITKIWNDILRHWS
jgi:hypothetical protein